MARKGVSLACGMMMEVDEHSVDNKTHREPECRFQNPFESRRHLRPIISATGSRVTRPGFPGAHFGAPRLAQSTLDS